MIMLYFVSFGQSGRILKNNENVNGETTSKYRAEDGQIWTSNSDEIFNVFTIVKQFVKIFIAKFLQTSKKTVACKTTA